MSNEEKPTEKKTANMREYFRQWRKEHPEYFKQYLREYRKNHPEKFKYDRSRYAKCVK